MNVVTLIGRLTSDPEVRYSQDTTAVARYTLAVDRVKEGTDFIPCVAFTKSAEFAEKYFKKGMKVAVTGRIQTGSYTNKDGQKVYTTDVVVTNQEFCEAKKNDLAEAEAFATAGFTSASVDEELPFAQPSR